ncbi:AAA family ATPase [Paraburkholderia sp. NMBU_R16]|uniref:ATP-binding protein n=1 Tax=Paraburkholderia sp. NMBU_R16 TaxID=2698676 RepID=UPI0015636CA6|nr:ATP-binding protein [Paraburkholderia sp. NMBU_R16]NRO99518.1 AAA family ATPase [Paraburkholderia sp. NMBU_R16]
MLHFLGRGYFGAVATPIAPDQRESDSPPARPSTPEDRSRKLIDVQRDRVSEANVSAGTIDVQKTATAFAKTFAEVAATAVAAYGVQWISRTSGGTDNQSNALAAMSLAQSLSSAISSSINSAMNARRTEEDAAKQTYLRFVKSSEEALKRRPLSNQIAIEKIDAEVRHNTYFHPAKWYTDKLLHRERLLGIPYYSKALPLRGTPEGKSMDMAIDKLIESYPYRNQGNLSDFFEQMRIVSNAEANIDGLDRPQAILYGEPGTGKTRFANAVSDITGLPLIKFNVGNDSHINNLSPLDNPGDFYGDDSRRIFGDLALQIIEHGHDNPIVFLDELQPRNAYILNSLKLILDPSNDKLQIGGPDGAVMILKKVTFIIACNSLTGFDEAFMQRTRVIRFAPLDRSVKRKILTDRILAVASTYRHHNDSHTYQKGIEQCYRYIDYILDLDRANPGARIVIGMAPDLVINAFKSTISDETKFKERLLLRFMDMHPAPSHPAPEGNIETLGLF